MSCAISPSLRRPGQWRAISLVGVALLQLAACGGDRVNRDTVEPIAAPASDQPAVLPDADAVAAEARDGGPTLEVAPLENPAVAQLVEQAEQQRLAGQLDSASSVLERALRVEPDNPRLWQRLAEIRLEQGAYLEAEEMAMRSLGLSARVGEWCRRNWLTLKATRLALGDTPQAERAAEQAQACLLPPPPRF
ncbi:MAG: tetratricopeptide repeat protein [Lysobacterales bacterium]